MPSTNTADHKIATVKPGNYNKIINDDGTIKDYSTVDIDDVKYYQDALALAIQKACKDADDNAGIEVTYDIPSDKYTIHALETIALLCRGDDYLYGVNRDRVKAYRKNSLAPIIGFDKENYIIKKNEDAAVADGALAGLQNYTAPFRRYLNRNKYAVLTLKNMDFDRLQSINTNVDNSFAILPILGNCSKSKQPWPDEKRFAFEFIDKYPDINNLQIMFTDYDGNLIDFNGHNHLLIFCITTLNNHLIDI